MAISSLFNKLMGKGVLGNVGDTVVSMGKDAQEAYAQHTNAVGQSVFGRSYDPKLKQPTKPTIKPERLDQSNISQQQERIKKLKAIDEAKRTGADKSELSKLEGFEAERIKYLDDEKQYLADSKDFNENSLLGKLSGAIPLAKDETKETVLEAATKAGTVNAEQKSALDYFMIQNQGKAYTPDSIKETFDKRDKSVTDKFQTKQATFLETPTSMPGMSEIGKDGSQKDLITLGAGAAVGGIVGSAMYDNTEGGMLTGLAGAGLGRGVARAVNKNLDSITAYGMKSVLGDQLVKEGDKVGYGIDAATKAKMQKLGVADADKLDVDVTTGKVTQGGKDFDLEAQRKATEGKATELTMEDIGFGDKVDNKTDTVKTFTENLINAEEKALTTSVDNIKTDTNISSLMKNKAADDATHNVSGYNINVKKDAQLTEDIIKQQVVEQRKANLAKDNDNLLKHPDYKTNKAASDKTIFENQMKSQALTNDGKKNVSLLEDQAKAAHAAIFKPQKNVAVTKEQADTMNLNNLKSKKESDLGAVQNIAKNMLTNPGGAGRLTGQYRNMILGGAALSGVAFTSNKRDYRRGINANKGNRI